jgi:hypothetical protein
MNDKMAEKRRRLWWAEHMVITPYPDEGGWGHFMWIVQETAKRDLASKRREQANERQSNREALEDHVW